MHNMTLICQLNEMIELYSCAGMCKNMVHSIKFIYTYMLYTAIP